MHNIFEFTPLYYYSNITTNEELVMKNLNRDISVGVLFIAGIFGFINGSFIISTVIFAMAAVFSNLHFDTEIKEEI